MRKKIQKQNKKQDEKILDFVLTFLYQNVKINIVVGQGETCLIIRRGGRVGLWHQS